eukprot:Colp12_sorted_trinity150504_noHs@24878
MAHLEGMHPDRARRMQQGVGSVHHQHDRAEGGHRQSSHTEYRQRNDFDEKLPELFSIHKGRVKTVTDYGAFVEIEGYRKNGLVHVSQLSGVKIEHPSDVVAENEEVWVKVIGIGEDDRKKISLSMKCVHQTTGRDLDPNNVGLSLDQLKSKGRPQDQQAVGALGAILNTICPKCGTRGHLAYECRGGAQYALLGEEEEATPQTLPGEREVREGREERVHKRKRTRSRSSSSSSSSGSSSESGSDSEEEERRRRKKKKEKKDSDSDSD